MTEKWLMTEDAEGAGVPGGLWKGRLQGTLGECLPHTTSSVILHHVSMDPGEDLLYSSGPWAVVYRNSFFPFWKKGGREERK